MYVCITGASSGIGKATAESFAKSGHDLIIGARRVDRIIKLKEELLSAGAKSVLALEVDVTKQASVVAFCKDTLEACSGKLDILLNNAGKALGADHVKDALLEDWQEMLDTNVMGVSRVTQQFLPSMIENKHGHIIFIGSIAGHQPYEGGSVYCASKFGVKAIALALKHELCGTGIRVSSIDPGMVDTEFSLVRLRDKDKADSVYNGLTPLAAQDVADCIVFAATRPAHVNIDQLIIMPTSQASAYKVHRAE